jgi:lactoylglutathione lyase
VDRNESGAARPPAPARGAGSLPWQPTALSPERQRENGELEATNYFFSLGDDENVLELTYNHDGRSYDLGTGYGHIAIGVDDLDGTLAALRDGHGIEPERAPYQVSEGGSRICFVRDPDT